MSPIFPDLHLHYKLSHNVSAMIVLSLLTMYSSRQSFGAVRKHCKFDELYVALYTFRPFEGPSPETLHTVGINGARTSFVEEVWKFGLDLTGPRFDF